MKLSEEEKRQLNADLDEILARHGIVKEPSVSDDELDTAMALRDKALAERDEARVEALHWRSLYETLLQQVQRRNLQLVKDSEEEGFPEYRFALKNLLPR